MGFRVEIESLVKREKEGFRAVVDVHRQTLAHGKQVNELVVNLAALPMYIANRAFGLSPEQIKEEAETGKTW